MDFRLNPFSSSRSRSLEEARQRMIRETSLFLSWALSDESAPKMRVPRKRVDQGGFSQLMSREDGQELVERWWNRVFSARWRY